MKNVVVVIVVTPAVALVDLLLNYDLVQLLLAASGFLFLLFPGTFCLAYFCRRLCQHKGGVYF